VFFVVFPYGWYPLMRHAGKARIILADHERLVVSYSVQDDTVYVLTPPGGDPRAALPAARLVLHDDAYQQLASYLGVTPSWPVESGTQGGRSAVAAAVPGPRVAARRHDLPRSAETVLLPLRI
jgi:hypothetical protein